MFNAKRSFSPKAMFTAGKKLFEEPSSGQLWTMPNAASNKILAMTSEGPFWVGVDTGVSDATCITTIANTSNTISALSINDIKNQVYDTIKREMAISPKIFKEPFSNPAAVEREIERHPAGYLVMHEYCRMTGKEVKTAIPREIDYGSCRVPLSPRTWDGNRSMTASEVNKRMSDLERQYRNYWK